MSVYSHMQKTKTSSKTWTAERHSLTKHGPSQYYPHSQPFQLCQHTPQHQSINTGYYYTYHLSTLATGKQHSKRHIVYKDRGTCPGTRVCRQSTTDPWPPSWQLTHTPVQYCASEKHVGYSHQENSKPANEQPSYQRKDSYRILH